MFFNSLRRKGKGDDVDEKQVGMVVSVHNFMNERTGAEVMRWEKMHESECCEPKLLKFMGKPDDLSPTARIWTFFGCVPEAGALRDASAGPFAWFPPMVCTALGAGVWRVSATVGRLLTFG